MWGDVLALVLVGLAGAGLMAVYVGDIRNVVRLRRHGVRTTGVVTDVEVTETDSNTTWRPFVAFDDQDGNRRIPARSWA